jgi:hypothetical protein
MKSLTRYSNAQLFSIVASVLLVALAAQLGLVDSHALTLLPFIGMAFPADAIDNVDLKALTAGGVVNEDVLQKIFMLSEVNTPFQDMIGTDTCNQDYTEWTQDDLGSPSLTKVRISGSDAASYETPTGTRVGNRTQINARTIAVSERARHSSIIGRGDELTFQAMRALQRVRQDVEAHVTFNQASVVDDNSATAGKAGGFSAWLTSNATFGATGANGGFQTGTKLVNAPTFGTQRVLAWSRVTALVVSTFKKFGNPTTLMSTPDMVNSINTFLISAAAAGIRANPVANINGDGPAAAKQTAQGYFQVVVTAFGFALTIVPNRMQQTYNSGSVDLLGIDPTRVAMAYLDGYKVKTLGKNGLSDRQDCTVDWTVKVYNEAAHFVDRDLNPTGTVTA